MDAEHRVELVLLHLHEHAVAREAGVVERDVEVAELGDRAAHERLALLPVGDVAEVRDRLAARGLDLRDHLAGRVLVGAAAVALGAEVVDHDRGAVPRELDRLDAAEAAPCSGDDRHLAVQDSHLSSPYSKARCAR